MALTNAAEATPRAEAPSSTDGAQAQTSVASTPSTPGKAPDGEYLSIGDVLTELREEFPELTSSKLRFLGDRELVNPERSSSGYRRYSPQDVERVRLILVLQRDHHMPLKDIREYLEAYDSDDQDTLASVRPSLVAVPNVGARAHEPSQRRPTRLRRREFQSLTGASHELLETLQEHDIVVPSAAGFYDQQDLDIAAVAVEMTQYGVEARHLRSFKAAADREASLVHQATRPLTRRTAEGQADADKATDHLLGLCVRMHAAMLGIRRTRGSL